MNLSSILSARNVTLVVFILVVLVLGTVFDTRVGPEGMAPNPNPTAKSNKESLVGNPTTTTKPTK